MWAHFVILVALGLVLREVTGVEPFEELFQASWRSAHFWKNSSPTPSAYAEYIRHVNQEKSACKGTTGPVKSLLSPVIPAPEELQLLFQEHEITGIPAMLKPLNGDERTKLLESALSCLSSRELAESPLGVELRSKCEWVLSKHYSVHPLLSLDYLQKLILPRRKVLPLEWFRGQWPSFVTITDEMFGLHLQVLPFRAHGLFWQLEGSTEIELYPEGEKCRYNLQWPPFLDNSTENTVSSLLARGNLVKRHCSNATLPANLHCSTPRVILEERMDGHPVNGWSVRLSEGDRLFVPSGTLFRLRSGFSDPSRLLVHGFIDAANFQRARQSLHIEAFFTRTASPILAALNEPALSLEYSLTLPASPLSWEKYLEGASQPLPPEEARLPEAEEPAPKGKKGKAASSSFARLKSLKQGSRKLKQKYSKDNVGSSSWKSQQGWKDSLYRLTVPRLSTLGASTRRREFLFRFNDVAHDHTDSLLGYRFEFLASAAAAPPSVLTPHFDAALNVVDVPILDVVREQYIPPPPRNTTREAAVRPVVRHPLRQVVVEAAVKMEDSGIPPDKEYFVRVRHLFRTQFAAAEATRVQTRLSAFAAAGSASAWAPNKVVSVPVMAPDAMLVPPSVSTGSDLEVCLSWDPPAGDGGADISGYIIERLNGAHSVVRVGVAVDHRAVCIALPALVDASVRFAVRSVNRLGMSPPSPASRAIEVAVPPMLLGLNLLRYSEAVFTAERGPVEPLPAGNPAHAQNMYLKHQFGSLASPEHSLQMVLSQDLLSVRLFDRQAGVQHNLVGEKVGLLVESGATSAFWSVAWSAMESDAVVMLPPDGTGELTNAAQVLGRVAVGLRGRVRLARMLKRAVHAGAIGLVVVDDGSCGLKFSLSCLPREFQAPDNVRFGTKWQEGLRLPCMLVYREQGEKMMEYIANGRDPAVLETLRTVYRRKLGGGEEL